MQQPMGRTDSGADQKKKCEKDEKDYWKQKVNLFPPLIISMCADYAKGEVR